MPGCCRWLPWGHSVGFAPLKSAAFTGRTSSGTGTSSRSWAASQRQPQGAWFLPPENLKAWLAPWRQETGKIISMADPAGALNDLGVNAKITGGWRQNGLRHSFISYRVALTGDVPRTALEAGHSPKMIFRHYREVVEEQATKVWFSLMSPEGWQPSGLKWTIRERLRRLF